MKIGKLPKEQGIVNLGKWYVGVEILQHHPAWHYDGFAFKPYFVFMFVKITDWGTEHMEPNGRPQKKLGGWWRCEAPIGICVKNPFI